VVLAVGDALVAQIPALLISVASGDGGLARRQGRGHRHADPRPGLRVAEVAGRDGGIVFSLGLVPGMPHLVFWLIGGALGGMAWWMKRREDRRRGKAAEAPPRPMRRPLRQGEASWDDLRRWTRWVWRSATA
jgi:flagellar biosynthesis protein FlhA